MSPRELFQCATCSAVYQDPLDDGSPYFHVCAPIPNPAYQPNIRMAAYDPREVIERTGHCDERWQPETRGPVAEPKATAVLRRVAYQGTRRSYNPATGVSLPVAIDPLLPREVKR